MEQEHTIAKSARSRRFVVTTTLAVAAALGVAACGGDSGGEGATSATDADALHGIVADPPTSVAGLSYADVTDGDAPKELSFTPPAGRVMAVYFGYTMCPDICPTTMSDFAAALAQLEPELRDRVDVAFVTVDPERDTPEVAREYIGSFFAANAHALRDDDPDVLRSTAEAFGVQYEVVTADDGTVEVGHSALLSLVDERGDIVVQWPFGVTADDLASDLRKVLDEGA